MKVKRTARLGEWKGPARSDERGKRMEEERLPANYPKAIIDSLTSRMNGNGKAFAVNGRNKNSTNRLKFCSFKRLRAVLLHIGLLFACVLYIILGAAFFLQIEQPIERSLRQHFLHRIRTLRENLLDELSSLPDLDEVRVDARVTEYVEEMLDIFDDTHGLHAFEHFADRLNESADQAAMWSLHSAALFTATTVIPVGYGYISPVSSVSRLLLLVYGLLGIPLALVTIADASKFVSHRVTKCFSQSLTIPTAVFLSLLLIYPIGGGILFHLVAEMSFLDAIYFSLTSIFTIGFGDITPAISEFWLVVFIVFGVILVTITIDFVAAELIDRIHFMGRHVGRAREIAGRMLSLAQSLNMNRGLTVGMTQLHALARFGLLGRLDANAISSPLAEGVAAFEPELDDMDFVDCGFGHDTRHASKLSLYKIS